MIHNSEYLGLSEIVVSNLNGHNHTLINQLHSFVESSAKYKF